MRPLLRRWGFFCVLGGLIAAGYFLAFFDTSVDAPARTMLGQSVAGGKVNDAGLLARQHDGISLGTGIAIVGGFLLYAGKPLPKPSTV